MIRFRWRREAWAALAAAGTAGMFGAMAADALAADARGEPSEPPPGKAIRVERALPVTGNATFPKDSSLGNSSGGDSKSWAENYMLGPGDVLSFSLYGYPELERSEVFVRPDGRIDYLQASGIVAAGKTIDQLREEIERALAAHFKNPRVLVTPLKLQSKQYVILGTVVDKGAFPMEYPITLIEAVARARGIETGLFEGNTVELADLPRSFLARGGKRLPIDFQKLFLGGDLSQNVELEPGDFIYFASAISNDVYVLGQVGQPGVLGFTPDLTVMGAIAVRGSFTPLAYRSRVLVIRGSLQNPETFVINVNAILKGREKDFPLQPKDIVFVAPRPWLFAEELLELAINTFLTSVVASWVPVNIQPVLPQGAIPQVR